VGFNQSILIFKALNGLIDWDFNFSSFKDIHGYNTRSEDNICEPPSRRSWGQKRFIYNAVNEWNTLPDEVRNSISIFNFKCRIRGIS